MTLDRGILYAAAMAAALFASVTSSVAQSNYPSRPIHLVVGFAAGGPTDVLARIIGGKMSEILGQQVVIENRTGASGNIAAQYVVRAPNDGYTILMGANSNAVNESLFKNLGFKFADDLVPIAPLAEAPTILVVHPSLDVKSVKDLIALAKAKPGEVMYATAGKGTTTHLAGELFNLTAGTKLTPVPYKGSGETTKDLLSGQIKVMFSPVPPVHVVRCRTASCAASPRPGRARSAVVPNLPTVAEEGLKDFDMRMWFGLMAPVGTPNDIVDKLSKAAAEALKSRRPSRMPRPSRATTDSAEPASSSAPSFVRRSTSGARSSQPSGPIEPQVSKGDRHGPGDRTAEARTSSGAAPPKPATAW